MDKFAIGIDKPLNEIRRQLSLISSGEGAFKFLRGGYGCGKTFMGQYTLLEGLKDNFAVSFVVVSPMIPSFTSLMRCITALCPASARPWPRAEPWKMPLTGGSPALGLPGR